MIFFASSQILFLLLQLVRVILIGCFLLGRNLVILFITIEVLFSVIFRFLGVVLGGRSLAVLLFSFVSVCLASLFLFPFLKGGLGSWPCGPVWLGSIWVG